MIRTPRIGALRLTLSHRLAATRPQQTSLKRPEPVIYPNVIQIPPTAESEYAALLDRLVNGETA